MVSENTDLNIPLSDDFMVPTNSDVGATSRADGGKGLVHPNRSKVFTNNKNPRKRMYIPVW